MREACSDALLTVSSFPVVLKTGAGLIGSSKIITEYKNN
jgi:hypothetical protein